MNRNFFSTGFAILVALAVARLLRAIAAAEDVGGVFAFEPTPMKSVAKPRFQESTIQWRKQLLRLPADAPNILIVFLDDAVLAVSGTFGDGWRRKEAATTLFRLLVPWLRPGTLCNAGSACRA